MTRISIYGDAALIDKLATELENKNLCTAMNIMIGPDTEADRLSLDLKDIASVTGILVSGLKLSEFVAAFIQARIASKSPTVEIKTARGRLKMDLSGKTEAEIAALIAAMFPFLK